MLTSCDVILDYCVTPQLTATLELKKNLLGCDYWYTIYIVACFLGFRLHSALKCNTQIWPPVQCSLCVCTGYWDCCTVARRARNSMRVIREAALPEGFKFGNTQESLSLCSARTFSFSAKCSWIIDRWDCFQSACLRCASIANPKKWRELDMCDGFCSVEICGNI